MALYSILPEKPGCYLFKNKKGKIIYIGKAKNLKKRVKSYFQKNILDKKTKALVSHIHSLDFFITDSEVEALILENNLIKKFKPPYNILLKDAKGYAYITITNEEYPRILLARKKERGEKYYGPFVSANQRDYIIDALRRIFNIRTCKRLPKKECMRYAIGLCSAPCIKKISKEDYAQSIRSAEFVLKGRIKELVTILTRKMIASSRENNFEKAMKYRNQLRAIQILKERQKMEQNKQYDEDSLNFIIKEDTVYVLLFNSHKGMLENKRAFSFPNNPEFLEQFLIQYYSENPIPKRIILPKKVDVAIQLFLEQKKSSKVELIIPKKGENKKLLDLIKKNISASFFKDEKTLQELSKKLHLEETPKIIECFDISHLSGTATVASMVQFKEGKPNKKEYRRYKLRTILGIDDFKSMKEVIQRRYGRLKKEHKQFPNLIVIDGGKGQLSSAIEVLHNLEIHIPIISLAKREEEIFLPNSKEPIILKRTSPALQLLRYIRDEAHRFAINYNRLLRKKNFFKEE